MLDDLRNTIKKLDAFSWSDTLQTVVEDSKVEIADKERDQLASGKDGSGERTTLNRYGDNYDFYAAFTVSKKEKEGSGLGAVTDRVTWYMTGRLSRSLFTKVSKGVFDFASNGEDEKFELLKQRSGLIAAELNIDSRKQLGEETVLPKTKTIYKEATGFDIT